MGVSGSFFIQVRSGIPKSELLSGGRAVELGAGVTHYLWQGKSINYDPLIYAALLAVLFGIRVVFYFRKRARTMTAAG